MVKGRHLLGLSDYSRAEVDLILARSAEIKAEGKSGRSRQSLAGKNVAMIFEKASTRTRVSFQVGIAQLGGHAVFLPDRELQMTRGEPIRDTARVISRYVDAVVIRARKHADVVEFASWSQVPVINGLTDLLHPCQLLADIFTLQEQGLDLDRIKVAFIGDGNNLANSWLETAIHYHFELTLACPPGYDPDPEILRAAREREANVKIVRDPQAAAQGADVLYTDVWVSMGQEAEKEKRLADFAGFQINRDLVKIAAPAVKVMHCLPAHRDQEITDEVIESRHSIIFDEAENRLHAQKAVLELIIGDLSHG